MMIDRYLPEIDEFAEWMDEIEGRVFSTIPDREVVREILDLKRQVSALRRIAIPQRDVIGRLARREFAIISPRWLTGSGTSTTTSSASTMRR